MQDTIKTSDKLYDELENQGFNISEKQRQEINARLENVLTYEPRIGIFGKTGVGKSSLCNALFGRDICPISDVSACTRNPQEVLLKIGDGKRGIKLVDVPGVGESSNRDEEYGELYSRLLPELDLVLWILKGDDRAYATDEIFYKNIVRNHIDEGKPLFFVLNQVDKIEPFREWNEMKHEPGPTQFQNIHAKIRSISVYFNIASSKIIPVSANEKYNLTTLVDEFVKALPKEKQITTFRAVNKEHRSNETETRVRKSWHKVVGEVISDVCEIAGHIVGGVLRGIGGIFMGVLGFVGDLFGW